ncbi:MAG: hypothetical protein LBJ14_08890, partial [Desulfarculales bacterium]|nr:hypothetical protein [Desulfarculales bacterium]
LNVAEIRLMHSLPPLRIKKVYKKIRPMTIANDPFNQRFLKCCAYSRERQFLLQAPTQAQDQSLTGSFSGGKL